MESGDDLLSRTVTSQVPSALKGLTSVFGMGTGGTPSSLPPEMVSCSDINPPPECPVRDRGGLIRLWLILFVSVSAETIGPFRLPFLPLQGPRDALRILTTAQPIDSGQTFPINLRSLRNQALDRLVSSSCMRCRTSTDDLSTR